MPNKRSPGQKGVLVMMDQEFREEIDLALPKLGYSDRSQFIRDVIYKRLDELGINVSTHLKSSPIRTGKGGRPRKDSDQHVEIGVNNGKLKITQKKKSTSMSDALAPKDANKRGKTKSEK